MTNQLIFKYGVMGSSKSANLLMEKFNYEDIGKKVLLLKPSIDDRESTKIVKSRVGIFAEAKAFTTKTNLFNFIWNETISTPVTERYSIVMIDESQFCTPKQIEQLRNVVDKQLVSVICYGLKTDFKTHLFKGSKRLIELSDQIIEIDRLCQCGNKAIVNARIDANGNIITNGDEIEIGFNYKPMCYKCWVDNQRKVKKTK